MNLCFFISTLLTIYLKKNHRSNTRHFYEPVLLKTLLTGINLTYFSDVL